MESIRLPRGVWYYDPRQPLGPKGGFGIVYAGNSPEYGTLARRNNEAIPRNFGGQIGQILLAEKYNCSPSGKVDGWGIQWLP